MKETPPGDSVQVWDLPVRVFHWLLVILVGLSWYSGENGYFDVHQWSGLAILTLVLTRVLWGFIGSSSARFSAFIKGPRAGVAYLGSILRRAPQKFFGHNPVGGWMILAFLLLLVALPVLGMFANDDVYFKGPLTYLVDKETSDDLTSLHKLLFDLLLILIVIHVGAVFFYRFVLRDDLITPMFTGGKAANGFTGGSANGAANIRTTNPVWALVLLLVVGGLLYWLIV